MKEMDMNEPKSATQLWNSLGSKFSIKRRRHDLEAVAAAAACKSDTGAPPDGGDVGGGGQRLRNSGSQPLNSSMDQTHQASRQGGWQQAG